MNKDFTATSSQAATRWAQGGTQEGTFRVDALKYNFAKGTRTAISRVYQIDSLIAMNPVLQMMLSKAPRKAVK